MCAPKRRVLGHDGAVEQPEIEVLDWPAQEARRLDLADRGVPRLLRIGPDTGPPLMLDDAEDWIRLPCSEQDQVARIRTLRARKVTSRVRPPRVDEHGILRAGNHRCVLSPVEAQLMGVLVANGSNVTTRQDLAAAGWPDGQATRNALDIAMMRLRRTVEPYGVMVRTVRSRGYVVDFGATTEGFSA